MKNISFSTKLFKHLFWPCVCFLLFTSIKKGNTPATLGPADNYKLGMDAFKKSDWIHARGFFNDSYTLYPHPQIMYLAGLCSLHASDNVTACSEIYMALVNPSLLEGSVATAANRIQNLCTNHGNINPLDYVVPQKSLFYSLQYGQKFALLSASGILLSGGQSVRTSTPKINNDETWQIVNAINRNQSGPVRYGDRVAFQMPKGQNIKLSGGNIVRTNTTVINTDEIWVIANGLDLNKTGEVSVSDAVAIRIPGYQNHFLTRMGSNVKSTSPSQQDYWAWYILPL